MRLARTATVAATLAALLTPATAHAATAHVAERDPGQILTLPVREALAQLPVVDEDRTGYQRNAFKHWVDADKDGWGVFAVQSPDKLAGLEYTTGDLDPEAELTTRETRWQLWAGTSIDRPYWYATASTDTPVALLKAVTECISDPAPLPRWREATYSYVKGKAQVTSIVPPSPPAPTPLDVQRAVARRPTARPAASVPRWRPPADPR